MKTRFVLSALGVAGAVIVIGQMNVGAADRGTAKLRGGADMDALGSGEPQMSAIGAQPDVIVGSLHDFANYGTSGDYRGYSIGTTSCNISDTPLLWIETTNQHPVIALSMFRLKESPPGSGHRRIEQIGQSWLKHGFFALAGSLCEPCQGPAGSALSPHCSDPYGAGLNGSQPDAGPKYQVNSSTGLFPYPPANPSGWNSTWGRRLRALSTDVSPALNPGATYYVEGQYVHPQDSPADSNAGGNNASHRQVILNASGAISSFPALTVQTLPAAYAWATEVPGVKLAKITMNLEGLILVFSKVWDNGNGTWDYEYFVYNQNVDRAVKSFKVPVPDGVETTNADFKDVDYHSGDGNGNVTFDGTDWPDIRSATLQRWDVFDAENNNANAIRWGTGYNYRFTASTPPTPGNATLDIYKPGTPESVLAQSIDVPSAAGGPECIEDIDDSGDPGFGDLTEILLHWGACPAQCPWDIDNSGDVGFNDATAIILAWGEC